MPSITNSLVGFPPLQVQALKGTFIEQDGANTFTAANTFTGGLTITTTALTCTANATFSGTTTQINTLNLGASGTAGALSLFSGTASKGKWLFTPVDNTGNTTMTITNDPQGGAYTYSVPDAGASAKFVMTQGTQTLTGNKTFATGITFGTGSTITGDIGTGTCSSNAVTISKMAGTITTESLSTAGGASQAITLTNTLIASTSNLMVQYAGGTNTTRNITLGVVPGSGSATITIYNNTAATALNGTLILKFLLVI